MVSLATLSRALFSKINGRMWIFVAVVVVVVVVANVVIASAMIESGSVKKASTNSVKLFMNGPRFEKP